MKYLVPHDFTAIGDSAAKYAINMAKQTNAEIALFHVVKSGSERAKAIVKLEEIIEKLKADTGKEEIQAIVKKGNIFEDIGETAVEEKCRLIIMGTHGAKGMQKVFGSYAIKVITNAKVPFLIVQDGDASQEIDQIVQPIDLTMESMQVTKFAIDAALRFKAKVHIIAHKESDAALKRKTKIHFEVLKKQFDEFGVDYEFHLIPHSSSLHNDVIKFGKKIGADMFAIAYHSESLLPQFDRFAQSILTNELKLPVLIVNSKQVSAMYF